MQYKITVCYFNCYKTKDVFENVKEYGHIDNWFIIEFLNDESFYISANLIASVSITPINVLERAKEESVEE